MRIRFTDIQWDLSDLNEEEREEVLVTLPENTTLTAPSDFEPETEGADLLSDTFGYCVESFGFEIL